MGEFALRLVGGGGYLNGVPGPGSFNEDKIEVRVQAKERRVHKTFSGELEQIKMDGN